MSTPNEKSPNKERGDPSPSTTVPFPASRQQYANKKKSETSTASVNQRATPLTTLDRSRIRKENIKVVGTVAVAGASNIGMQSDSAGPDDAGAVGARSVQLGPVISMGQTTATLEPAAMRSQGNDGSRDEFMLEAQIVEEPELAHAEPLERGEDNNTVDTRSKKRMLWLGGVLATVVVGLIVVVVVLLVTTRASSNGIENAGNLASLQLHFQYKGILPASTIQAIEQTMESPQRKAWNWLLTHPNLNTMEERRMLQLVGLVTVYYSSDAWNKIDDYFPDEFQIIGDWLSYEIHECDWADWVQCAGGEIVSLKLPKYGHLPGEVSLLKGLSVFANDGREGGKLTGTLPSELGIMTNLKEIRLTRAQIDGSIPSEVWLLTQLNLLDLHTNNLTGSIPSELGLMGNMTILYLGNNGLTGFIPSELGLISSMCCVYLHNNRFTGSIPSELGPFTSFRDLYLSSNRLTGSIPTELGQMLSLGGLRLGGNSLNGPLPSSVGLLTSLYYLDLQNNNLTGSVPSELGLMESIEWLDFSHNTLSGSLPSELGLMANIKLLMSSNNSLTGSIPSELGLNANITNLELSANSLTGSIPPELGELSNLRYLELGNTSLTGSFPSSQCSFLEECKETTHTSTEDDCAFWVDCDLVECSCCSCR